MQMEAGLGGAAADDVDKEWKKSSAVICIGDCDGGGQTQIQIFRKTI